MEGDGVGILLGAAAVEHRGEVGAAAEPRLGGDDEARVHVHCRHVRVGQVRDQRDAGGPEPRIGLGAGNLAAELGGEFAVDGGDVHAHLLEQAALEHRHDAAAAGRAAVVGARPWRAHEAGGAVAVERGRRVGFERLERRADVVAQQFEPLPGARLARFELTCVHFIHREVLLAASATD